MKDLSTAYRAHKYARGGRVKTSAPLQDGDSVSLKESAQPDMAPEVEQAASGKKGLLLSKILGKVSKFHKGS